MKRFNFYVVYGSYYGLPVFCSDSARDVCRFLRCSAGYLSRCLSDKRTCCGYEVIGYALV